MSDFQNKTLLITGGTGSFGQTVLRKFISGDLREIRIFSRDEKKQDDMRHELQKKLNCAATIHMDPIITDDQEVVQTRETIQQIISNLDSSFTMHDFRMVEGPTHTNLIFDVVIPYDCKYTEIEVIQKIKDEVHKLPDRKYFAVIQIDRKYC